MHPIPTNLLLTVASLCIGGIPGRSLGDGFSPDNIILAFVPPGEFLAPRSLCPLVGPGRRSPTGCPTRTPKAHL